MGGKWREACTHPVDLRDWGKCDRLFGQKIMNALNISQDWLWAIVYIILVTLIWPLAVLVVSIPFGQFNFFRGYIRKLGKKMGVGK